MKRLAFTLLELVFVIIVIGILAVLAMPNFSTSPLEQAAEQVASHIRYTQHLAMVDDKFDPADPTWFQKKWQIRFRRNSGTSGYVIFSDTNNNKNSNNNEIAIDPLSGELINGFNLYKAADLTASFDIIGTDDGMVQSCDTADGSSVTESRGVFAFDNLGRPYLGIGNEATPYQYLMTNNCTLTLKNNEGKTAVITVRPETGYVSVSYP